MVDQIMRTLILLSLLLVAAPALADDEAEAVTLYKNPSCMCCVAHANYLRDHGFDVTVIESDALSDLKAEHDVPERLAGCHTAIIGDYVFEGHVPVASIRRVLENQPDIDGISVPGMPPGSPGMPGELYKPIRVWSFTGGEPLELFDSYETQPE